MERGGFESVNWYVYLVRCSDGSLYCGITVDLERRISEHNSSRKGAKYTRSRRPVVLVHSERFASRAEASRREYRIKRMSKGDKESLLNPVDSMARIPYPGTGKEANHESRRQSHTGDR